jgi:CheY-like chemotaxis protein
LWQPILDHWAAILGGTGFIALLIFVITDKVREYRRIAGGQLTETLKGLAEVRRVEIERLKDRTPQRYRICLIEDNETTAETFRQQLADTFDVTVYSGHKGGAEAVKAIIDTWIWGKCFDLVIVDYGMPYDGATIVKNIRDGEATRFVKCRTTVAVLSGLADSVPAMEVDAVWEKYRDGRQITKLVTALIAEKGHQH